MTSTTRNVLMVGVGGQGIIMASDILTLAAMHQGFDAKKSEIHGMSQRGGSVFAHIRYGKKIHSPVIAQGQADILFSLEPLEALRWLRYAGPSTAVISATTRISPAGVAEYPAGVEEALRAAAGEVALVDTDELGSRIGNPKFLNVAFLGVISGRLDITDDSWQRAISESVPSGFEEANWTAFGVGRDYLASA